MKTYLHFLKLILASRLSYRLDFIFTMISGILWTTTMPLFIYLIYSQGAQYPGWELGQILIFAGIATITFSISKALFYNIFFKVSEYVREGKLEVLLIKPKDELILLISESFEFESLIEILIGIILIIIGSQTATMTTNIPLLIIFMTLASMLYFSFIILGSSLLIIFVKGDRTIEIINNLIYISDFPKNIYPALMQLTLTIIMPIFIFSYYPASQLLGFETQHQTLIITSTIIITLISIMIWKKTIKKYTGAGG